MTFDLYNLSYNTYETQDDFRYVHETKKRIKRSVSEPSRVETEGQLDCVRVQ